MRSRNYRASVGASVLSLAFFVAVFLCSQIEKKEPEMARTVVTVNLKALGDRVIAFRDQQKCSLAEASLRLIELGLLEVESEEGPVEASWLRDLGFQRKPFEAGLYYYESVGPVLLAYVKDGRWRLALVEPDVDPREWLDECITMTEDATKEEVTQLVDLFERDRATVRENNFSGR